MKQMLVLEHSLTRTDLERFLNSNHDLEEHFELPPISSIEIKDNR